MTETPKGDAFTKTPAEAAAFDPEAWISGAKPLTDTAKMSNRPDLVAQIEDLEEQLQKLNRAKSVDAALGDGGDDAEQVKIAQQIKALHEKLEGSWMHITLKALSMGKYAQLQDEFEDDPVGMATHGLAESVIEPKMTVEQWLAVHEVVGAGQFAGVWLKAQALTVDRPVTPDFSPASSSILAGLDSSKS
ncbi:hypothetical protein [Segeticoccus rhizosphaerae]|uniref:hypothetical protein n=1 Tax=Segeticoccus rhizosphaerae TaxID=1104777 RepID=UPI0012641874|nr:hypothetical protein [Segeticoccus rhizosphaerae]